MTGILTFAVWLSLASYLVVEFCTRLLSSISGDSFFSERAFQISAIVDAFVWNIISLAGMVCALSRSDRSWLGSVFNSCLSVKLWVVTIIAVCASGIFLAVIGNHSLSHIVLTFVALAVYLILTEFGVLIVSRHSVANWCVAGCVAVYLSVLAMFFIRPLNKIER